MVAARVASSVVRRQVRYVAPVPAGVARGLVAEVYAQAQDEQKLVVPPVLLHSPAPPVLAAYWMLMREPLLAGRAVDRRTKEAVAAGVSVANTCPYCVDMHSISLYDLATEDDAEAVADDRLADLGDPVVRSGGQLGPAGPHRYDAGPVPGRPRPGTGRRAWWPSTTWPG